MRELGPGLWHWQAPHPDWRPSEPWDQNVSSYAIVDDERLLLFDPLGTERARGARVERETAIVLPAPWHERDAQRLVERLGVPVFTPLPDTAQYLMDTYGITAEQAGDGSPDLVWLLREEKGVAPRTRRATGCRSVRTCSQGTSRTTPCSGSKASMR